MVDTHSGQPFHPKRKINLKLIMKLWRKKPRISNQSNSLLDTNWHYLWFSCKDVPQDGHYQGHPLVWIFGNLLLPIAKEEVTTFIIVSLIIVLKTLHLWIGFRLSWKFMEVSNCPHRLMGLLPSPWSRWTFVNVHSGRTTIARELQEMSCNSCLCKKLAEHTWSASLTPPLSLSLLPFTINQPI